MPEELPAGSERRATSEEGASAARQLAELRDQARAARDAIDEATQVIDGLREESRAAAEAADLAAAFAARQIDGLKLGMQSRLLIGQAQGILMERFKVDAEKAFAYLVRASSHRNVKLREVAAELVRTRQLPVPMEEEPHRKVRRGGSHE